MKTKKAIFFLFVFLSYIPVLAQVDTAWVRRYNAPGHARAIAIDDSGYVYVTGWKFDAISQADFLTIKYAPTGDTLWARSYNGPANGDDFIKALSVDKSGNVYVTGSSTGNGTYEDYATIKYAPNGDTLWVRRYNGPKDSSDVATSMEVDNIGNVYVTGRSLDTVSSYPLGYTPDYLTIKYSTDGDIIYVKRYNGAGNSWDEALDVAIDDSGNVYVTGNSWNESSGGFLTIKYSSNGDTLWTRKQNAVGEVVGLELDKDASVFVAGFTHDTGYIADYATLKYSSNGDLLWSSLYDGKRQSHEYSRGLALDTSGNAYVTGFNASGTIYFVTVKYNSYGDTLWVRKYEGPVYEPDYPYDIAVDGDGNAYVVGQSRGSGTSDDFVTIKYAPNGDTLWVRRYNGPSNGYDYALALAVDKSRNVYVAGGSENNFCTIKYIQFACSAKPGDANSDDKILLSDIVTIINFLFKSKPAPNPSCRADANADGNVLLSDIVYLINFLFKSGPAPQKSRECCL